MLPSPSELQYFVEVASTQNVSRAAERLGISQPTLSLAIQRLEHDFGTALLIRTKSGVKLTHAGQKLAEQARILLGEWERIQTEIKRDESEIRGRYVIGCHPSVALYSLPPFLPTVLDENPELDIKLVHDLSRKITEDVISFKVDFGIVVNPWNHPDLIIRSLSKDVVTLYALKKPTRLQDPTSGNGVLVCDADLAQTQSIQKQLAKHNMQFGRVIHCSNLEVITSIVASGAAAGILPGRVAGRIKSFGLQPISDAAPKFHDRICLIYRADAQRSRASRTLAQKIEECLRDRS